MYPFSVIFEGNLLRRFLCFERQRGKSSLLRECNKKSFFSTKAYVVGTQKNHLDLSFTGPLMRF